MVDLCRAPGVVEEVEEVELLTFFNLYGAAASLTQLGEVLVIVDNEFCEEPRCLLFFARGLTALVVVPCVERTRAYIIPPGYMRYLIASSGAVPYKIVVGRLVEGYVDGVEAELPQLAAWALRTLYLSNAEVESSIEAAARRVGLSLL